MNYIVGITISINNIFDRTIFQKLIDDQWKFLLDFNFQLLMISSSYQFWMNFTLSYLSILHKTNIWYLVFPFNNFHQISLTILY
jgi:hypothetical protein